MCDFSEIIINIEGDYDEKESCNHVLIALQMLCPQNADLLVTDYILQQHQPILIYYTIDVRFEVYMLSK